MYHVKVDEPRPHQKYRTEMEAERDGRIGLATLMALLMFKAMEGEFAE